MDTTRLTKCIPEAALCPFWSYEPHFEGVDLAASNLFDDVLIFYLSHHKELVILYYLYEYSIE